MSYIYFDPKYKIISFALVHNFPSVIGLKCPLRYHLFDDILSATFYAPLGRVNMARVALTVLRWIAFANFDSLCIVLTVHNKETFNKFVVTTHNLSYVAML